MAQLVNLEHLTLPNGIKIFPDRNVPDIGYRNWMERWFSFPWHPFVYSKPEPKAYLVEIEGKKICLVSRATFEKLTPDSKLYKRLAGMEGLEPTTDALTGRCSTD